MTDQEASTIFEDINNAFKKGFSRENMLGQPEKFSEEAQLHALEQNLGVTSSTTTSGSNNNNMRVSTDGRGNDFGRNHTSTSSSTSSASTGITTSSSSSSRTNAYTALQQSPLPPRTSTSDESGTTPLSRRNTNSSSSSSSSSDDTPVSPSAAVTSVPHVKLRVEEMSLRQAIWVTMDDPSSSRAAQLIAGLVMGMIILSCTAFVIQTLPQFVESTDSAWNVIESLCITVFTIEFALRISTCPSLWLFVKKPLNLVDFLAILPFYLELMMGTAAGGSAVIRIIRLVRIFRIFKLSRYLPWVRVFTNALALSLQPLLMLVLVVMIAMVLFSSVIYYAERGEWSEQENAFVRYNPVTDLTGPSPYQSIPDSFWWCIVTMTTVGYGDVYPVTSAGRFIAALASLSGILVVAIPVSIISTNFNSEYAKLQRTREKVKARMLLLKRHFRDRKTGLDAVLDEIEDIVKRNTQEFQSELESLFEQARSELTEELQEVLRMSYERRRQLHLAALAAGRVQSSVVSNFNQMSLIKKTPATVNGGGGGGNGKNNKNGSNTNNNNSRGTSVPVFSSSDTGKDMRDELKQLEGGSGVTTASRSSKLSQIKE